MKIKSFLTWAMAMLLLGCAQGRQEGRLLELAEADYNRGNYGGMITKTLLILEADPDNQRAIELLIAARRDLDESIQKEWKMAHYQQVLALCRHYKRIEPFDEEVIQRELYARQVLALEEAQRALLSYNLEEAVKPMEKLLALGPQDPQTLQLKASLERALAEAAREAFNRKDYSKAAHLWQLLLRLSPTGFKEPEEIARLIRLALKAPQMPTIAGIMVFHGEKAAFIKMVDKGKNIPLKEGETFKNYTVLEIDFSQRKVRVRDEQDKTEEVLIFPEDLLFLQY